MAFAIGALVAIAVGVLDAWLRGDPVGPVGLARAHLANPALWVVDLVPVLLAAAVRQATPAPAPNPERNPAVQARIEALIRARDEARAASQAKSQFLASMSHELRTPLNAIIGYSELVREGVDEGAAPDPADLDRIATAARHLLQLIHTVLDLSRIEVGRMSVVLEPLAVGEVVREVEATVAPLAATHRNRFSATIDPALAHVRADPVRLRQVLVNLLGNAFKFTQDGEVTLVVYAAEADALTWAVFEVRDTGVGMSPTQVAQLFRDYQQVDADLHRRAGGSGLGLALSQRLANLMGGRIEVQSEEGRGSVFALHLPVPDVIPEPRAVDPERRVLIFDDDPATATLDRRLAQQGWSVTRLSALPAARRGLEQGERWSVALVDLHTDGGAGWDLLDHLADHVAVLATSVDDDDQARALAAGASAFLPKPLEPRSIAATLEHARRR